MRRVWRAFAGSWLTIALTLSPLSPAGSSPKPAALSAMAPAGPADLPRSPVPAAQAREKAAEILDRPEYARARPNVFERLYESFVEWIATLLGESDPERAAAYGPGALVVLGIVALLVLHLIVSQIWLGRLRRKQLHSKGDVILGEGGRPSAQWMAEAAGFELQGLFRDAVRCHWRAVVAEAAALGLLVDDTGRTTRDHLRDMSAALPAVNAPFASATELFEQAWYSLHKIGSSDLSHIKQWTAEVRAQFPEQPVARFGEVPLAAGGPKRGV